MRTPIFSQVKICLHKMADFEGTFLVVPDSYGRKFRAVARSVIGFFVKQSLQKYIKLVTLNGKMVYKKF